MAPKKYTNGRKRNDGGNEVLGVGLIIVAAFILLCIVIPPVIGLVSRAVNGIVTGIFGFTSYPFFICLLLYGIALAKNIRPAVSGKTVAAIAVGAICLIAILQLALTHRMLNAGFSEYVSYVYDSKNATAGVLFGILAYGMQAGLSLIFTYILLCAAVVVCALALLGVFGKLNVKRKTSYRAPKDKTPAVKPGFEKSGTAAAPVQSVMDTSLFVGTIEPRADAATLHESGRYSELPAEQPKSALSGYFTEPAFNPELQPYNPPAPAAESDKKSEAMRILYGDKSGPSFSSYGSVSGESSSGSSYSSTYGGLGSTYTVGGSYTGYTSGDTTTGYGAPSLVSEPVVKRDAPAKPPKIVHSSLPEVVLPVEKDFSDQVVGGEIINGDDLSAQLDRTRKQSDESAQSESRPPVPEFNTRKTQPEDAQPKQAPIMNGDFFGTDKYHTPAAASAERVSVTATAPSSASAPADEPKYGFSDALFAPSSVSAEHGLPPIYTPDEPKVIELEPEKPTPRPAPVVQAEPEIAAAPAPTKPAPAVVSAASAVEQPTEAREDSFEALLKSERSIRERAGEVESARAESVAAPAASARTEEPVAPEIDAFDGLTADESELIGWPEDVLSESDRTDEAVGQTLAPVEAADEPTELPKVSAFIMSDEVEDLSESHTEAGRDHTGYYTKETASDFEKRVGEIETGLRVKKSKVMPNQIDLDDYTSSAADDTPVRKPKRSRRKYTPPPTDFLLDNSTKPEEYGGDCQEKARILEETLENLKLPAKVLAITKGPAVTRYELEMPPGQPIKRIESFKSDIAYNLASNGSIRIETPIPGKRAVGIEVPNEQIAIVALRDIILSREFQKATSLLTLSLGKDIAGQNIVCALDKMPHLLIAGQTGSGKSACLNSIIMSILYKSSPDDVRLILVDPKQVEFSIYQEMPHMLIPHTITDADRANNAFKWLRAEQDRRFKLFSKCRARNLAEYNNSEEVREGREEKLFSIVTIVDELAELMLSGVHKELTEHMMSVAQKGRAAGLHLILATQRPSVNVITGTIKANFPSRIAFSVASFVDSKTILDEAGAETLLGRGDMLYAPSDKPEPTRVQGAYVTTEEVTTVVDFVKANNEAYFDEDINNEIMSKKEPVAEIASGDDDDAGFDVLMKSVLKRVIESGQASTSMIQRRFSVGYARASRIIDQMESNKFIGPLDGAKPREVYITREQFREIFGEDIDEVS